MSSATEKLERLINNETSIAMGNYSHGAIARMLALFGDPHRSLRCVHVAGTNGKGSVCHMLHAIAREAGVATGLYTSPHLLDVRERIVVNGEPIGEDDFSRHVNELFAMIERHPGPAPTYFDALTIIAFRRFLERRVDLAVIETGLGGRLDSTNVITPLLSVITDIGLDHMQVLGADLAAIAAEKAGIIKPGVPVVTSNTAPAPLEAISRAAALSASPLYRFQRDFFVSSLAETRGGYSFDFTLRGTPDTVIGDIALPLPVAVQVQNAATAATAALLLSRVGIPISSGHIRAGLAGVSVPGRFQILSHRPDVIYDPAHNPDAIRQVLKALKARYAGKKVIAVLSFMGDKDYRAMIELARRELAEPLLYFELPGARSLKAKEISESAGTYLAAYDTIEDLCSRIRKEADDSSVILVTGTFRLYGAAADIAKALAPGNR